MFLVLLYGAAALTGAGFALLTVAIIYWLIG
jgi:hypothetical protein